MVKKLFFTCLFVFLTLLFSFYPASAFEGEKVSKLVLFDRMIDIKVIEKTNSKIKETYTNIPAAQIEIPLNKLDDFSAAKSVLSMEGEQKTKAVGQVVDWSTSAVHAQKAWKANLTGKNVKIAIIDSGISFHSDLNIFGGQSFVSYTNSFTDDNGHGTHVAGIIAAQNNDIGTVGVAPDSQLYALKVLDSQGNGYLTDIISAIDWAITNEMDIINLSLGSLDNSPTLEYAINKAYNSGILIVAAGGNGGNIEGIGNNVAYPAKYESVIAVSALDQQNNRATFSSTGASIEFSAPGVSILSTYINNEYARLNGTSMATGFVTGNLALLKEMYPMMSNRELREQLKKTALDLGTPGTDIWFGYGLVQSPQSPERIAGKDRFEVAVNISKKGWSSSNIVFIVNNNAFADALSAAPLAYKKNAPILITGQAYLNPLTKEEITRLGSIEIIMVGGTGSLSESIEHELKNMGKNVRRINGKNRFEVSRNIAFELGDYQSVVVANGLNFPDALAIAPYASKNGLPILLTRPDYLPQESVDVFNNKSINNTIVVGGEASVSGTVFKSLPSAQRIGGKDRYEVATNIFHSFFPQTDRLFIATGHTFADALTGSVLAAKENTTLLLTSKEKLSGSALTVIENHAFNKYIILGGIGSVSNNVLSELNY